jgi:exodeoxyribonuclease III
MKIISFNINSVRAHMHQLEALINSHAPEIIALQETKVTDVDFPIEKIKSLGYHSYFHGQKTHYGVAILSNMQADKVVKGFSHDTSESQKRLISCDFTAANGTRVTVINGYFPQGESRDHPIKFPAKQKFYADLTAHLAASYTEQDNLAVVGDINISEQDCDIGIGEKNAKRWLQTGKCSFLPEERAMLKVLTQESIAGGLTDSYRHLYPQGRDLSWFDYRSRGYDDTPKRGLRIDQIMLSKQLLSACTDTGIDYQVRAMEKPSDHAPVWAELDL